jgi:CheY-like chemotaxis protein
MMGGSIWVESGPGGGSTFHVIVRLGFTGHAALPRDEQAGEPLRGTPVLVVDDHEATRDILTEMLRHRGMVPTVAGGAEAALAAIRAAQNSPSPFRLALLDAQLPGVDGFVLAEKARRIPGFWAPIMMMLPHAEVGCDATRCRELGIVDYCTKPVRESDLVKAMAKALETSVAGHISPKISDSCPGLGRELRILLAESNEVSRVLLTHMLEKRGYEVVPVTDGMELLAALKKAGSPEFDLLLMDLDMPDMTGLEAARAVRETEGKTGKRLPIIAVVTRATPREEDACRAAAIDGYLAKPLLPSALIETIHRVTAPLNAQATNEAPPDQVFDKLSFLSRLEGDEELGGELIAMFLGECPKLMDKVRQAAKQYDASLLERAAHTLKGSVGDIAAHQAFDAARTLEMMAREGKLEDADAALASLEVAVDRLLPELHKSERKAT